ncbi:unnamed protein product [Brassica rapa]|uniref:Uncharacterized protein n=1 Tax=Brassica campestris TaxID=3711 RepID=A0A8D9DAD8_BRACM|nr:unnamed protein product [Brassica rapa]
MDSHGKPRTSCVCWRTPTDILCTHTDSHGQPMCADRLQQIATDVLCALADTHGRHPTWAKITRTVHGKGQRAESKDLRADMCTDGHPLTSCVCWRTPMDDLCTHTDSHGQPMCADRLQQIATDVLCALADTHGRHVCTEHTAHTAHKGQNHPNSPREGSACCPRTNVLICVMMDSHERHVCADGHTRTAPDVLCVLTDTHGRPVCADGHPQTSCDQRADMCTDGQPQTSCTSCVCWRTPTDVLCVLKRLPTWAKITQTVHGKGQRAESKDQRADMCTDGQPQTSSVTHTDVLCVLTDTHGHTRTSSTDVLCVLANTHGRPVCTEQTAHPRRPVCAGGDPGTSCVHGRHVYSPRGPKSPEQSTGRVSVLTPRTNVLICVLMDIHGRPVCADGHTQTHKDSHRRPVCAGGHPRTSCPTWDKITQTVHGKGQRAESKDQRADMSTDVMCVLTDTHGHTRTATNLLSTDVLCVLPDTHGPPRTSCVCWRTPTDVLSTDVLCVLVDTHGRPVCTEQTAHEGQNHPNSPQEGPACGVQGPTC